jgi:hypothetical protein
LPWWYPPRDREPPCHPARCPPKQHRRPLAAVLRR